eukprot:CAMPEP_0172526444 /NCGR_PEP_ID=MMETSP1067-20121228/1371_1 /TAXON_ID=265564 ORGANISM="Thalassiosira punctigera, Strain Tpunct2005C2" /NCGR_SAMPLE_ID=MMETSP1067 /ASSEMBLY_ACC=CAM_ASM_000444 /LENGTH=147 /DNA_ID=CAMNT_0013309967 /DNA_START=22 /DNA_END=462 /DNA_ORIENTATION=-
MKFATIAVALALFSQASGFAPNAGLPAISNRVVRSSVVANAPVVSNVDTSLNLFGFGKAKKFNAPAKIDTPITESEVRSLFELWNSALATGDSSIVASRYAESPVLLATVSDTPRTDFDSVKDYFDAFLLKKPQGKILDGKINIGDG